MKNGERSFWLDEVGAGVERPQAQGTVEADVAIVGAGFTGLWTAYYLLSIRPELSVVVLERDIVGAGASGRNGGWLTNSLTGGKAQYVKSHGWKAARAIQNELTEAVDEVIEVCRRENIEADIVKSGSLLVARNEAQHRRMTAAIEADKREWPELEVRQLSADEVGERVNIRGALGASMQPHCARVHPAKLVKGLAAAVERLGGRIYEKTEVVEITPRRVLFENGSVSARHVVRATEGFTPMFKKEHRALLPMNSSMVITEPLPPDAWETIGWQGAELIEDYAHVYVYSQRTADGRIAIGGRGKPYRYGSGLDVNGRTHDSTAVALSKVIRSMYLGAEQAPIAHAWCGVLGVSRDWRASVGLDPKTGLGWAGGYVGTGVTAANVAGRTLAELIAGESTARTRLPWVGHRSGTWEVEPLRWVAVNAIYAAYGVADRVESRGYRRTFPSALLANWISGR